MFNTIFRIIAFVEGISYLLLLFIAVPIKYLLANDSFVKLLGMPHGVFFIIYILLAIRFVLIKKTSIKDSMIILIASLIPFGTFYVDKKFLKVYFTRFATLTSSQYHSLPYFLINGSFKKIYKGIFNLLPHSHADLHIFICS